MAVLFVTGDKYHPEDIRPNIIIPYANSGPILDSVKLNLGIQGLKPQMVKLEKDFSYHLLFKELWEKGDPFIIVEHDILPFPGAVQELWTCPEPWCGFPYYVFGELRSYLGCTKFVPKELGPCPLPEELVSWQLLDKKIEAELMKRGHKGHVHSPAVSHLHFSHVRQTEKTLEHPNFWEEGLNQQNQHNMNKPKFSIAIIAKNEANTLPKLFNSLIDFRNRGGEIILLDTGSNDNTVQIATDAGCIVHSVGAKFMQVIGENLAEKINKRFIYNGEPNIVVEGNKLFNFAAARNYVSSLASNDMICTLDADEAYTKFDIDTINDNISNGYDQFEYQFIFAHSPDGRPAVQFIQSKFFNRKKVEWTGVVHEVLTSLVGETPIIKYLDESVILLEHFQEPGKEHRGNYLVGLALDCYNHEDKDRQSHYLARELHWTGRPHSAIAEFERHISMGKWAAERAQSMIFIAEAYGRLGEKDKQISWYHKAFELDPKRREALMGLAHLMKNTNNHHGAAAYAGAALQIPWSDYYANNRSHYEYGPHEILYWAKGWMGDIPGAQYHILEALKYQPYNSIYLRDTKYYFEYGDAGIIGWMTFPELSWLFNSAKKHKNVLEVGSWKGRSTHALLSGCAGTVTAVDTWLGSIDVRDDTNWLAKQEDVFAVFQNNTKDFKNLKIHRKASVEAAADFPDNYFDMIFIDAGHTEDDVNADIKAWLPKVKKDGLFCGHDYVKSWMGVIAAVDSWFGKPDGVCDSIWHIDLSKRNVDEILTRKKSSESPQIPPTIFTAWLSEDPMPAMIKKCIDSQKINGYTHKLITLENYPKNIPYVNTAIAAKKWVKAVDYLKAHYLYTEGGIFLDADVEMLPGKNFDALLNCALFTAREENGFMGYSIVGSAKYHPVLEEYIIQVPKKFRGDDDLNFESSMEIFTHIASHRSDICVYTPDYFFPYNHQTGKITVTPNTICFHHFMKSWVDTTDLLPKVSIILPTLNRPEGLDRCLESIDKLYYPKHLIETVVILGDDTVPVKVDQGCKDSRGDVICYAADDLEFTPDSLYSTIQEMITKNISLVSFNTGPVLPDKGNICEHFIIKRDFINQIGGKIFDTEFHHVGVDNLLWARAVSLNQAYRCEKAVAIHHHFSTTGTMDTVYEKGWSKHIEDRALLKDKLVDLSSHQN